MSNSGVEVLARLIDGVGPGCLKVRERVVSKKVDRVRDAAVLGQDPRRPCVNVTDGLALERGAPDPIPHPADVSLNFGTTGSDTSVVGNALGAAAVQILRPNAHANDLVREGAAQLVRTTNQRIEFVLEYGASSAGPEAYEDIGVRVDGCAESRDGVGAGAALDRGVETRCAEAWSTRQALRLVEEADEVVVAAA